MPVAVRRSLVVSIINIINVLLVIIITRAAAY